MLFGVVGVSFQNASIEIRERLSFSESEITDALHLLRAKEEVGECIILSTCNRVEIYALLREARLGILRDFFRDFHKYSGEFDGVLYMKSGEEAVTHLCRVASGLDSMVLGEPQIFGQVKDAYAKAQECGAVNYAFDHLMSQVFSLVKKVRSKTKIGQNNVSVSYSAVKLARELFEELNDKRVLILGAGEMGELTVRNLIAQGVKDVMVANRTFQRAVELSEKFSGTPLMFHEIREYIPRVDIVVSSLSVSSYILSREDMVQVMECRGGRAVFLVDISVPRSIDPLISQIEGCHLYNIDDLKAVCDWSLGSRREEAQKADAIIEGKVSTIFSYIRSNDILPTMISIREKAEEIRKAGIASLSINEEHREAVEAITRSIVNKILHHSESKFREYSSTLKG